MNHNSEQLPALSSVIPIPLIKKPEWYRSFRDIVRLGNDQNLVISKCCFQGGWSVLLPSGSILFFETVVELSAYVKGNNRRKG